MNDRLISNATRLVFSLAAAGYLIQCFTPLRLTEDVIIYLSMTMSALHGGGFTYQGLPPRFPVGYPAVVWSLARVGLGTSLFMNLMNVLGAALGLAAAFSLARAHRASRGAAKIVVLVCLLSWPLIKGAALPLTDVLCFGASLAALAAAGKTQTLAPGPSAWICRVLALLLAVAALSLRVAGGVVVAVVLFECFIKQGFRAAKSGRFVTALLIAAPFLGVGFGVFEWLSHTHTLRGYAATIRSFSARASLPSILAMHFRELGELALNIPQSRLPAEAGVLFFGAGLVTASALVLLLAREGPGVGLTRTFLPCHALLLFAMPWYSETRAWLPAIPFMVLLLVSAASRLRLATSRRAILAVRCYALYFVLTGLLALGYSDWLTVSRRAFIDAHANRFWVREYSVWLLHEPEPPGLDPRVLPILREFGGDR